MGEITVRGKVVPFIKGQYNIVVEGGDYIRLHSFWDEEGINTDLQGPCPGKAFLTLSKEDFVIACDPGDLVSYTIESWRRADGVRIRGKGFRNLSRPPT